MIFSAGFETSCGYSCYGYSLLVLRRMLEVTLPGRSLAYEDLAPL